jgi:hypothetical protein
VVLSLQSDNADAFDKEPLNLRRISESVSPKEATKWRDTSRKTRTNEGLSLKAMTLQCGGTRTGGGACAPFAVKNGFNRGL